MPIVQLLAIGPQSGGQNRSCSATGFLIDEEGYLITNAHVVEDARQCLQNAPTAKILAKLTIDDPRTAQAVPCDVIAVDDPNDLALLKTERPLSNDAADEKRFAELDARAVTLGTTVTVRGYPAFSWQPVTQSGRVVWTSTTPSAEVTDRIDAPSDGIMMNIRLRPGNSGSPVYRSGGGVIAVVERRDPLRPEYSIAIAIHYAIELADHHSAPWHAAR